MTTYTLFRLSDRQAQKELATQRRYMQRHRAELADTRNPDALRRYMEFNRLSIICAKRGYINDHPPLLCTRLIFLRAIFSGTVLFRFPY